MPGEVCEGPDGYCQRLRALGTYRGAAALCGTTHKTVKRVLERRAQGQAGRRQSQPSNTACVQPLIEERVRKTDGRISAKRLLPVAQAAGYGGSLRNLQRAVMSAKAAWKQPAAGVSAVGAGAG